MVSRIKSSDSGLLNSVSNAASSMAGKICVPSGALAVIFHSSKSSSFANVPSRACSLEHVLVYTPSGFVVQHELLSSVGIEVIDFKAETWSGPQAPTQNEELKVKAEPIQWWDVCRRSDNLEREECVFGSSFDGQNDPEIDDDSKTVFQEKESAKEKKLVQSDSFSSPERSHWYLSNAEVKINSSSLPVWQKTEVFIYFLLFGTHVRGTSNSIITCIIVLCAVLMVINFEFLDTFLCYGTLESGMLFRWGI